MRALVELTATVCIYCRRFTAAVCPSCEGCALCCQNAAARVAPQGREGGQ